MSTEVIVGLAGAAIGSGASLLAVYLTQNLVAKREESKSRMERDERAIAEVYSPLVFILDKTQNLFSSLAALKSTYAIVPEGGEGSTELAIVHYVVTRDATKYPKVLEDLLLKKAGLIKSPYFYIDLVNLQSYLSTSVNLLDSLIMHSMDKPADLEKVISSFAQLIAELSAIVSAMRTYSMQMSIRHKIDYKWLIDEKKHVELENYINQASQAFTGEEVPDWEDVLKKLKKL